MNAGAGRAVLVLILVATALRLGLAAITDLGLDEAYALAVSRQFQLSWFDHPPLVFWITGGMQALFGPELPPALLRLPFILLSAFTTWLLFRLTARHFGETAGAWTALLFSLAPFFFLSSGSWLVPDGPLNFALVLSSLGLSGVVLGSRNDAHWRHWLLAGTGLGLALLSKYHAALFGLGALIFFAGHPAYRHWLRRPQPYVAAFLALALFTPVLVWNAQNDWASFAFQLGRGEPVPGSSPELVTRLFLTEAAYLLPTTALLLFAAIVWAYVSRRSEPISRGFFLALGLPLVVILDLPRFWTWQSYAHWAMPGWMLLLPLAGAMLSSWERRWSPMRPTVLAVSGVQFVALVGAVVLLLSDFRIRDPGIDAFRVEAGSWRGVAEGLRAAGVLGEDTVLMARRWPDAARIIEAVRTPYPIVIYATDPRGLAWLDASREKLGADVLLVTHPGETPGFLGEIAAYFDRFEPVGTYPIEPGNPNSIDITRGVGLKAPMPLPYGDR